jgi:hypothetical protein
VLELALLWWCLQGACEGDRDAWVAAEPLLMRDHCCLLRCCCRPLLLCGPQRAPVKPWSCASCLMVLLALLPPVLVMMQPLQPLLHSKV